jgi:hypothetical protein
VIDEKERNDVNEPESERANQQRSSGGLKDLQATQVDNRRSILRIADKVQEQV